MNSETTLTAKRALILEHVSRSQNIKITLANPKRSLLEAIISRADRSFGRVIHRAYQNGAMFDGYHEYFSWDIWEEAMRAEGIDYETYFAARDDNHPWSFIQ